MANSHDYADLEAYQDFVQGYRDELITRTHFGFPTSLKVNPFANVKGKDVISDFKMLGPTLKGYNGVFNPGTTHKFSPVEMETVLINQQFQVEPLKMQGNYEGRRLQPGTDIDDWPFEGVVLDGHIAQANEEKEVAIWQAVKKTVGPADDDPILEKFDGYGKLIQDAVTGGLPVVATGTIDSTNIIQQIQAMHDQVGKALKMGTVQCYLSVEHEQQYYIDYGTDLKYTTPEWMSKKFPTARVELVFLPGMEANKIVMTPSWNMLYPFDVGVNLFKFKEEMFTLGGAHVFRIGAQIAIKDDQDYLVVNDQW